MSDYVGINTEDINNVLEHFGKKGMKWGQRNANRKARDAAIKEARKVQFQKKVDLAKSVATVGLSKNKNEARDSGKSIVEKAMDLKFSDNAKTANRMTSGEKVATGLFVAGAGAVAVAMFKQGAGF